LSVINQMLKDLEQRQGDQHNDSSTVVMPVIAEKSAIKNIVIIVATIAITLAAVYMFYLQNENQRLKNVPSQNDVTLVAPIPVVKTANNVNATSSVSLEKPTKSELVKAKTVSQRIEQAEINVDITAKSQAIHQASTTKNTNEKVVINSPLTKVKATKQASVKPVAAKKTPIKQSSMVITRKQLTPEVLAKQKMNRAKEAVANNNITKAEQLFEDVLLILPTQKDARKQLAALWFGRQSYQAALNLLSQGIHLDPSDNELRVLKAQIHIKQRQHLLAMQVLQAHPQLKAITDVKYQSMLATQAQSSKQYAVAIAAYEQLISLQNYAGRWYLGLGIAYDSDSQFILAAQTYHLALNQQDLSNSARQFVNKRLQELGE